MHDHVSSPMVCTEMGLAIPLILGVAGLRGELAPAVTRMRHALSGRSQKAHSPQVTARGLESGMRRPPLLGGTPDPGCDLRSLEGHSEDVLMVEAIILHLLDVLACLFRGHDSVLLQDTLWEERPVTV